ncbi:MAG: branched-chain amino acid transaminase [Candidatus Saccharimonadales bacterium]
MLDLATSTAYMDSKFIDFADARLSIASAPLLYGLSVYTVFGVSYNNDRQQRYLFRLHDHYRRLCESAKIIDFNGFEAAWPYERFEQVMTELVQRNQVEQDVLVRVTVYVDEIMTGTRMHGLPIGLSAFVYPVQSLPNKPGIHVCISSWQRTADNAIPSRAKVNGSYINSSLMKNEALLNGYDDAVALDEHGHVSESTVANLFLVRKGILITPHAATDILEGITRSTVLVLADKLGIVHEQRSVDRSELYLADEAFLSGSSAQITPILSVDKRTIGSGQAGTITNQIAEAYYAAQHDPDKSSSNWLTVVEAPKI